MNEYKVQLAHQVAHWASAAMLLQDLEDLAAPTGWAQLERYLEMSLRQHLTQVIDQLKREAVSLQASLDAAQTMREFLAVSQQLLGFRRRYLRVETTLDFYADAINTRTTPRLGSYLKACDTLAYRSMSQLLDLLNKPTPVALTYIDKGLGASILKAGLRLWDATSINPVAAIKVTRHNLYRPTALIHEAGHQVAHILGWNEALAAALGAGLSGVAPGIADVWASWSSEIAADAFAFVHTGYASVAALQDVVDGGPSIALRYLPGDPHPIAYLRVLLGVEMCRLFYGAGPWDVLGQVWQAQYPLSQAPTETRMLLLASMPALPKIAHLTLQTPLRAFGGQSLAALINPERVRPEALLAMEQQLGAALYTSMHWIWTEALRLLALTGLRLATVLEPKMNTLKQQEAWMLRLGGALQTT